MSYADPARAPKPDPSNIPQEPTGPVAADSLAAESTQSGGGFAENENIAQLSVKGAQSTLANTDTSGATALHAARSGAERERQDAKGLGSDGRGVTGVKYPDAEGVPDYSGTHSQEGYVGGPNEGDASGVGVSSTSAPAYSGVSGDSFADGGAGLTASGSGLDASKIKSGSAVDTSAARGGNNSSHENSTAAAGGDYSSSNVDIAPNYAATVSGSIRSEGELKPKGKNLVEGDIPQTKTFTGNVGGDKDPGRLAEQDFEKINADTAGGLNYGAKDKEGNPYDVLESERA